MSAGASPSPAPQEAAQRTVWTSLRRVWPYFSRLRSAWLLTVLATIAAAATEPLIPAMMQPLLDSGFTKNALQLWKVPLVILLLFGLRGLCSFVAQVALTKIAAQGLMQLRQDLFSKLLDVRLSMFAKQSSSELANKVVYEVQTGSFMLVDSVMSLVRNAMTVLALLAYLLYLNWKLTLVVAFLIPGIALVMRALAKRLYGLVQASQKATDSLAYVVEENVLAHRDVRLHAAQQSQSERFNGLSEVLRRLSIKQAVASAAMAPHANAVGGGPVHRHFDCALPKRQRRHHRGQFCILPNRHADAGGSDQTFVGHCQPDHARTRCRGARAGFAARQPQRNRGQLQQRTRQGAFGF
jgi:ATP-binding cassette, subfamily B, bacterial MsbA